MIFSDSRASQRASQPSGITKTTHTLCTEWYLVIPEPANQRAHRARGLAKLANALARFDVLGGFLSCITDAHQLDFVCVVCEQVELLQPSSVARYA